MTKDDGAKLAAYVDKIIADWPKLDDEKLNRIAGLLRCGRKEANGESA